MSDKQCFQVRDIAERYAVREHTVLAWIRAGELQAMNVGVRPKSGKPRWRITTAALEAFEAARSATPEPARKPRRKKQDDDVIRFY